MIFFPLFWLLKNKVKKKTFASINYYIYKTIFKLFAIIHKVKWKMNIKFSSDMHLYIAENIINLF